MEQPRLTPTMSSRMAMVLDFVTAYIRAHSGLSPSYGEIAAACGLTSRQHARDIVTALVASGKLRRLRGKARGLQLPSDIDEAVRMTREAGYLVVAAGAAVLPQHGVIPLTFSTLPRMPDFGHVAGGDGGSGGDGAGAGRS